MPSFSSPQTRPFRYEISETGSPLKVQITQGEQGFSFHFSLPEWSFLGPLILGNPETTPTDETHSVDFWRAVLDYTPQEEVDFVMVEGWHHPLPEEVFTLWTSNADYELDIWQRAKSKWEAWVKLGHDLLEELPEAKLWESDPPSDKELRQLEFELTAPFPNRVNFFKRLHGLGLLGPADQGQREHRLLELGCSRLARWRRACVIHHWVSPFVDGMEQKSVLTSPVALDWFYGPPTQQRYLDPLSHLKFAVHEHIKREPPAVSSAFVVSMGGRLSGAFYYQLGPGSVPQLVSGGEPQAGSPGYEFYQHNLTPGGDRLCELAARAARAGFPRWGGRLAALALQNDASHGQSWVEIGVALFRLQHQAQGRACLEKAQALGHSFSKSGELADIWQLPPEDLDELPVLQAKLGDWQTELARLPVEEATAGALLQEVLSDPDLRDALKTLALPAELFYLEHV